MLDINKIYQGDCLEVMSLIDEKSIDMILCDLPYGTTACKWDIIINLDLLWTEYKRIIKDNCPIILFGSQPFTTKLISSNLEMFKYELIWNKEYGCDFQLANIKPLKSHENIIVFGKNRIAYNPQMVERVKELNTTNWKFETKMNTEHKILSSNNTINQKVYTHKFPCSIININSSSNECNHTKRLHPTQKPVELFEYLIKTYSNENDLVLDNCIGSGTTAIACINTNRNFIGIEKEQKYVDIANKRISEILLTLDKFK